MIKQNQTYLNRLHVVMDAVCIYFAGFAAWYIRFKCTIFGFWLNQEIFDQVFGEGVVKSESDRTWTFCICDHCMADSELSSFFISVILFI